MNQSARTSGTNWQWFLPFKSTFLGLFEFKGYQWHDLGLLLTNVWFMTYLINQYLVWKKSNMLLTKDLKILWGHTLRTNTDFVPYLTPPLPPGTPNSNTLTKCLLFQMSKKVLMYLEERKDKAQGTVCTRVHKPKAQKPISPSGFQPFFNSAFIRKWCPTFYNLTTNRWNTTLETF